MWTKKGNLFCENSEKNKSVGWGSSQGGQGGSEQRIDVGSGGWGSGLGVRWI